MSKETMGAARPCYRDYVIVDGRFIGRFEEMYRDIDDPWGCSTHVDSFSNRVLLELLRESPAPRAIPDLGCGLGVLTQRIYDVCRPSRMYGCDVSHTAIAKAKQKAPQVNFFVHDLLRKPGLPFQPGSLDLIVVAEVVWYILPVLSDVFGEFVRLLIPRGSVVLKQAFYPPGEQQYGRGVVSHPGDLLKYLTEAGLCADQQVSILNQNASQTWICRATRGRDG